MTISLENGEQNSRGRPMSDELGFLKLLFRRQDMPLMGMHAIGEHGMRLWVAPDRLSRLSMTPADVARAVQEQNIQAAAGKDGTIKHVMSGVNPQGCQVFSFKKPSDEELDHTFLWRYLKALPERRRIGIFNRSYYGEVLVVKVHPELRERQKLPPDKRGKSFWQEHYDDLNHFERHLSHNGTIILKFFLHISKNEEKKRFLERLETPEKHWKFSASDLAERAFWKDYMEAFEETMSATSTEWAPWYVIPADHK